MLGRIQNNQKDLNLTTFPTVHALCLPTVFRTLAGLPSQMGTDDGPFPRFAHPHHPICA
jgi:hypothetical protein